MPGSNKRVVNKWRSDHAEGIKLKQLIADGTIDLDNNDPEYINSIREEYDEFSCFTRTQFKTSFRRLVNEAKLANVGREIGKLK